MFISIFLTAFAAVASALPVTPPAPITTTPAASNTTTFRLGKRNVLLPTTCTFTDDSDTVYPDLIEPLKAALFEVTQMIPAALAHPKDKHNWAANFFDPASNDYDTFRKILTAAYSFSEDAEFFDTIHIDCAGASSVPRGCHQKEWDGSDRIAVTDVENDIIYLCPSAWKGDSSGNSVTRLWGSIKGLDDDGDGILDEEFTDGYCPDRDGERHTEDKHSLYGYQFFATTLLREIAHTGSAIRKVDGSELKYKDEGLHASIEKYGWAATLAFWEWNCGYEIVMPAEKQRALAEYLTGKGKGAASALMPYTFDFDVQTGL